MQINKKKKIKNEEKRTKKKKREDKAKYKEMKENGLVKTSRKKKL